MSYYGKLNLEKEPFSTSPDPRFFYRCSSRSIPLNKLEIAIRLRRGLSIVFGGVGTGKTTLARALLQGFNDESDFIFHIILAPSYRTERQFLAHLCRVFRIASLGKSAMSYKDALEQYLFQKGVEEDKTIVLLIDEGQNLSPRLLEVLRVLLNYETNEHKLLQLIIMSQMEILPKITRMKNFIDRVAFKYILPPLSYEETKNMIHYRLSKAGYKDQVPLFTDSAIREIYQQSRGYPRRITALCHEVTEYMIMMDRLQADSGVVREVINREKGSFPVNKIKRNENFAYSGHSFRS